MNRPNHISQIIWDCLSNVEKEQFNKPSYIQRIEKSKVLSPKEYIEWWKNQVSGTTYTDNITGESQLLCLTQNGKEFREASIGISRAIVGNPFFHHKIVATS